MRRKPLIETYQDKYPKTMDREELLAFYDFPAKHWQSIRTSNPIIHLWYHKAQN